MAEWRRLPGYPLGRAQDTILPHTTSYAAGALPMITLTIDGRRVTVPPETSVLDAARWLGIRIPTLCHVPGHMPEIEPAASCFLCAVQIEGRRTLSPSCAA